MVRAAAPIAAAGGEDQAGVCLQQRVHTDQAIEGFGRVVLDHHVGCRRQPDEELAPGRVLEVDAEIALAGVEQAELDGFGLLSSRRASIGLTLQRLNLDDVCAQALQQHSAVRAHERLAQIEDGDTCQRVVAPAVSGFHSDLPQ